jgi:hypothetical protein
MRNVVADGDVPACNLSEELVTALRILLRVQERRQETLLLADARSIFDRL